MSQEYKRIAFRSFDCAHFFSVSAHDPSLPPIFPQSLVTMVVAIQSKISTVDVLISGAGPAGLMAANALAKAGVSVRVVDKK